MTMILEVRNVPAALVFIQITGSWGLQALSQRRMKMRMPSSIATWCLILFFFLYGLSALGLVVPEVILGLLALGVALFTLIGR
jgi:hypothetical protein